MKGKQLFGFLIPLLFVMIHSNAQQAAITPADIQLLTGNWKGSLTYLDYSTKKSFTMPANVRIDFLPNRDEIIFSNNYPNEPKANNADTVTISDDGRIFDGAKVTSKKTLANGTIQITTEYAGRDGNDNAPALIRHTYTLGKTVFIKTKEVQFEGKTEWIKRNEFSYVRE